MKHLLVLGAGTAGTIVVNKLRPRLPADEWRIIVVDPAPDHHYQPGYLFVPFGTYAPEDVVRPTRQFVPDGVDLVVGEVDRVVPDDNQVLLVDGTALDYDQLVIASGATPTRPRAWPRTSGA